MSEDDAGRIQLSVPARPESLDLVHPALEQMWHSHDQVPTRDRIRFETAVVEIFANVVEHAFAADGDHPDPDGGRRLDLTLCTAEDGIEAIFTDNGRPVELDLSQVTMADELEESGRGLAMAIAALDDLSYERTNGRNRWRLTCRLGSA